MTYGEAMRAYQDAIYDALVGYTGLTAIVPAARIGDYFLPSDTDCPYIAFREIAVDEQDMNTCGESRGKRLRRLDLSLIIIDDARSKLRSTQVAEKVELALASTLTLAYGTAIEPADVILQSITPNDELGLWQTTLIVRTRIAEI
jgi:hypothetical protein